VVDEDPMSRVATHHALRGLGCRLIDEAWHGRHPVQLLGEQHYALVISDWEMRVMRGVDLLSLIRETPQLVALPVVISAFVTPELVAQAAETGVSAFLPRPLVRANLDELLRIYLGPRRSNEPLAAPSLRLLN
jgi:CheY-like chemotaxis protein